MIYRRGDCRDTKNAGHCFPNERRKPNGYQWPRCKLHSDRQTHMPIFSIYYNIYILNDIYICRFLYYYYCCCCYILIIRLINHSNTPGIIVAFDNKFVDLAYDLERPKGIF